MRTVGELLGVCARDGLTLGAAALRWQAGEDGKSEDAVFARMEARLRVMRESAQAGLSATMRSVSGMVGGQAAKMIAPGQSGRFGPFGQGVRLCAFHCGVQRVHG